MTSVNVSPAAGPAAPPRNRWLAAAAWIAFAGGVSASGQPLTITFRGLTPFGTTATDQFGQSFTVTGVSGIAWVCAERYVAVMDNSNKLIFLDLALAADGSITSAVLAGGLTLAETRDFEGVVFTDAATDTVFLSEEGTPAVHEYRLGDGSLVRSLSRPAVFDNRRSNLGFESLGRSRDGGVLWTANEEALTVDGPISSPSAGTVVRLLRYDAIAGAPTSGPQFAYLTDPWHGSAVSGARCGLVELAVLPDGRLLGLERSLAFSLSGLFRNRIYAISTAAATDVSGLPGLIGASYNAASKQLLWTGFQQNIEGLTVGPRLAGGNFALLGIVDDGDPISTNNLAAWELSGVAAVLPCPAAAGDANCDGSVDFFDIDPFLDALFEPESYTCAYCGRSICTVDVDCSGAVDFFDIDPFLQCLFAACAPCP